LNFQPKSTTVVESGDVAKTDEEKKMLTLHYKEEIMGILRRVGDKDLSKQVYND